MKLYTEEQVRRLIEGYYDVNWIIQDAFDELTPIELPSNADIVNLGGSGMHDAYNAGVKEGARWVIEQIKHQAKP